MSRPCSPGRSSGSDKQQQAASKQHQQQPSSKQQHRQQSASSSSSSSQPAANQQQPTASSSSSQPAAARQQQQKTSSRPAAPAKVAQSSFPPRAHLIWHKFMPLNSVPASQRKPGFHADPASEGWPYKPLEGWTYETHNPKMKGNLWAAYRNL